MSSEIEVEDEELAHYTPEQLDEHYASKGYRNGASLMTKDEAESAQYAIDQEQWSADVAEELEQLRINGMLAWVRDGSATVADINEGGFMAWWVDSGMGLEDLLTGDYWEAQQAFQWCITYGIEITAENYQDYIEIINSGHDHLIESFPHLEADELRSMINASDHF